MPNRKIKHIVAKLVGASTEETLDVYDVDAIHTDKIYNALDQTAAGYVLDARQGKALNDSLANYAKIEFKYILNHGTSMTISHTASNATEAIILVFQYGDVAFIGISNSSGSYVIGTDSGISLSYSDRTITIVNNHANRNYRVTALGHFA